MVATVNRRCLYRLFKISFQPIVVSLLAVLSTNAISGNWEFNARTVSSLSYIDNINLATKTNAESSSVFELTPGFGLVGAGRRLQVNADYQLQGLFYSNNPNAGGGSDSQYFHRLSASSNSELIERLLFADASASVTQQSSSGIGQGTVDNFSIANDRGTVNRLSLSPYFLHQVGNGLRSELRYRYDDLSGDAGIVTSSTIQTVSLKMDRGSLVRGWQWSLLAQTREIDYQLQSDQTFNEADVGINHHIFSRTIVNLHVGTEKVKYHVGSIGETGGDYWLLGVDFQPGKRTLLSLKAGERYYGDTYGFSLRHNTRRSVLSVNYTEDLTNNSLIQLATTVGESVTYPVLNNNVILRKTLAGRIEWNSSKSTIAVDLADTNYDYKLSDNSEHAQSARASWQWQIGHNFTLTISDYFLYRKLDPANEAESLAQAEVNLSRAIWSGASSSLSVVNTRRDADSSGQDYSQKRLTLAINIKW